MNRNIYIKCPYCGKEVTTLHDSLYDDIKVVVCDLMEGGCDRAFVADIKVRLSAKSRKIEGEELHEA